MPESLCLALLNVPRHHLGQYAGCWIYSLLQPGQVEAVIVLGISVTVVDSTPYK
jgi:hypothetical protein